MHIVCFTSVDYVDSDESLMRINSFCKAHNWPRAHISYIDISARHKSCRLIEIKNVSCSAELLLSIKRQSTRWHKPRYIIGGTEFYAEGLTEED